MLGPGRTSRMNAVLLVCETVLSLINFRSANGSRAPYVWKPNRNPSRCRAIICRVRVRARRAIAVFGFNVRLLVCIVRFGATVAGRGWRPCGFDSENRRYVCQPPMRTQPFALCMPSAYRTTPGVGSDKKTFLWTHVHTRRTTDNDCESRRKLTPPEYKIDVCKEFRLFGRVSV